MFLNNVFYTLLLNRFYVMKKKVLELTEIIKKYGYWSDEVTNYNSTLDYELMVKVNNKARELSKNVL